MDVVHKEIPSPPYYAVIFTSRRTEGDNEYQSTANRIVELAADQDGFLGIDSVRDTTGSGITVSYWRDEASIAAWRSHAEHTLAREFGRRHWYEGIRGARLPGGAELRLRAFVTVISRCRAGGPAACRERGRAACQPGTVFPARLRLNRPTSTCPQAVSRPRQPLPDVRCAVRPGRALPSRESRRTTEFARAKGQ